MKLSVILFFYSLLLVTYPVMGQEKGKETKMPDRTRSAGTPPKVDNAGQVSKISDGIFKIGKVMLNQKEGYASLPATVALKEGLIELLLCTKWGRVHETVLVTEAYPVHLQTALLLLGLKFGSPVEFAGDSKSPLGDKTEIWVEWGKGDKKNKVRIEQLAIDKTKNESMPNVDWVFTGSQFVNGVFFAQQEGSIITTYRDPNTMFDNPLPEGADDTVYLVNSKVVPDIGTQVTVYFKKPSQSKEEQLKSQK